MQGPATWGKRVCWGYQRHLCEPGRQISHQPRCLPCPAAGLAHSRCLLSSLRAPVNTSALAWRWESTPLGLRDHFWCLSAAGMWNINKALTLTHLRPLDGVRAILCRPVVMESPPVPGTEWGWQGWGRLRATPLRPAKGPLPYMGSQLHLGEWVRADSGSTSGLILEGFGIIARGHSYRSRPL